MRAPCLYQLLAFPSGLEWPLSELVPKSKTYQCQDLDDCGSCDRPSHGCIALRLLSLLASKRCWSPVPQSVEEKQCDEEEPTVDVMVVGGCADSDDVTSTLIMHQWRIT